MSDRERISFAVIGAGNGGQAMAAHLALMGFQVNLFNRSEDKINDITVRDNSIELRGQVSGIGRLNKVTIKMHEAIEDANTIMVVVPASAHTAIAKICSPYLQDGQIVILNPGRTAGAIEFSRVLKECGSKASVTIAETQTIIYTSRLIENGKVEIFALKRKVPLAAFPSSKTKAVIETMRKVYSQLIPANSVLETGLSNVGAILHPTPTLLSASWIESPKTKFKYYYEAITPTVARLLELIDQERINVAEAFGIKVISVKDWLYEAYSVQGDSLYQVIQNNDKYSSIDAPETLQHRYIFEDIPTGLVPMASLGDLVGVATPNMKLIIQLASKLLGIDFWEIGRTVEGLGLKNMSKDEIRRFVETGD